jgi:hypothetical protein
MFIEADFRWMENVFRAMHMATDMKYVVLLAVACTIVNGDGFCAKARPSGQCSISESSSRNLSPVVLKELPRTLQRKYPMHDDLL